MDGALPVHEMVYEAGEGMTEPLELKNGTTPQIATYEQHDGAVEESMYTTPEDEKSKEQLSSSREVLNCALQEVIDEINAKRKRDSSLLAEYKQALDVFCSRAYASMEASVFSTYEDTNKAVEEKIQELVSTLERIEKLEAELEEFKSGLTALYSDIHGTNSTVQTLN